MTRCGKIFLVVAALVCAGLLAGGSVARGDEGYKYERGGVLFYARFDGGSRDSKGPGGSPARLVQGGGSLTNDGVDSVRGSSLKAGDGLGYLEYGAEGAVLPEEGTIEMWIRPGDWSAGDLKKHVFVEITGEDGGVIRYGQGADDVNVYSVKAPDVKEQNHWDDKYPGLVAIAQGSGFREGTWKQVFLIWKKYQRLSYYRGYLRTSGAWNPLHRTVDQPDKVPSPGNLKTIRIGDFGGEAGRNAFSFIDEVYIYNRALSYEECQWAMDNTLSRTPGADIPANFAKPSVKVIPDPLKNCLEIRVDSGNLEAEVHGTARLSPESGTVPAEIKPEGKRFGVAWIAYSKLPSGKYQVIADVQDAAGASLGGPETELMVPEDSSVWLGNKLGIPQTPPPPWTPILASGESVEVWGRRYALGAAGLPSAIHSLDKSILSGPIELVLLDGVGKKLAWSEESREVENATEVEADVSGVSVADGARLSWRCHAEFDGMVKYDVAMPAGVAGGGLELRIPIKPEYATLWGTDQIYSGWRGSAPTGQGVVWSTTFLRYLCLSNEEVGLAAFLEDNRAWIKEHDNGMRMERTPEALTLVYDFAPSAFKLDRPWELTIGLQATPVKPRPKNWRLLRDNAPGKNIEIYWPGESEQSYFCQTSPKEPDGFRNTVADRHRNGFKVLPYFGLNIMSPDEPDFIWFQREWEVEGGGGAKKDRFATWTFVRVVPSWADYIIWRFDKTQKDYGIDGIYVDFATMFNSFCAPEYGIGYERDGRKVSGWPIFAMREIWKRIYTLNKQRDPGNLTVAHIGQSTYAPVVAFIDVGLTGEGTWKGQLRDNYLDVLPLDVLRGEFSFHHLGLIPWFLPQWSGAQLEDKDVAERFKGHPAAPDGSVKFTSVEKSLHMFGLGLLHDFSFWPICGTNPQAASQYYAVLDEFGIGDAEIFGYWDNSDLIDGQTEEIKASAYRKPEGGALVIVYNTTREPRTAHLTVAWERLKSKGPLGVIDAYTEKPIEVCGKSVTIEVPPLNYRLLWVK